MKITSNLGRILYQGKLPFKIDGGIKIFHSK
jgi:hypothetical protein